MCFKHAFQNNANTLAKEPLLSVLVTRDFIAFFISASSQLLLTTQKENLLPDIEAARQVVKGLGGFVGGFVGGFRFKVQIEQKFTYEKKGKPSSTYFL